MSYYDELLFMQWISKLCFDFLNFIFSILCDSKFSDGFRAPKNANCPSNH